MRTNFVSGIRVGVVGFTKPSRNRTLINCVAMRNELSTNNQQVKWKAEFNFFFNFFLVLFH